MESFKNSKLHWLALIEGACDHKSVHSNAINLISQYHFVNILTIMGLFKLETRPLLGHTKLECIHVIILILLKLEDGFSGWHSTVGEPQEHTWSGKSLCAIDDTKSLWDIHLNLQPTL